MKNGTARLLRGIIKLMVAIGIHAIILGSWIFGRHYSPAEMLREYFVLVQMRLGASITYVATKPYWSRGWGWERA